MATDETRDLPQANSLRKVRGLVAAVASGRNRSLKQAGAAIGLSPRHAHYYGTAASLTLGFIEAADGRIRITPLGAELLATSDGGLDERQVLRKAIADSISITSIAPDLIEPDGPTVEALTRRLVVSGLSPATARRRASTLLAWRKYVLERQARLPMPLAKVAPARAKPRAKQNSK